MKKLIYLSFISLIILMLCSCGASKNEEKVEEIVEITPLESLYEDIDNGAKAQLNVGKYTEIYGRVSEIFSDYCTVILIKDVNYVDVYMPIEVLAEFEDGQFVAIVAKVKSAENSVYTFEADKTEDLTMFDEYLHEELKKATTISEYSTAYNTYYNFMKYNSLSFSMVCSYLEERASWYNRASGTSCDLFLITDDEELKEFLHGKWLRSLAYTDGTPELHCIFNEDGSCAWEYAKKKYISYNGSIFDGYHYDDGGCYYYETLEKNGDWEVSESRLRSFMGEPKKEYNGFGYRYTDEYFFQDLFVLSEDAFICDGTLHMRVKPESDSEE